MRSLAIIILFNTWLPVSAENFYTGSELLEHCKDCIHSVNVSNIDACAYCISNMSSIHDAFVDWEFMEPKWCLPSEITLRQLTAITMIYIQENPSSLHQYSTNLIADSFIENYPCSK